MEMMGIWNSPDVRVRRRDISVQRVVQLCLVVRRLRQGYHPFCSMN